MKIPNTEYRIPNRGKIRNSIHSVFSIQNSVLFVLAEVNIGEELKLQNNISIKDANEFQSVGTLISAWLPNVYILGGILVLILIIASGFMWITNAGDIKKIEESQKILTFAIMGFIFLFASYWIIQIVQVLTGIPILNSTL